MSETGTTTKLLLVDDHVLFREGISEIFAAESDLCVVGEAGNGKEAVELAVTQNPDVVLLDIEMPGVSVEETLHRLLDVSPSLKIIILTMHDEPHFVRRLITKGVRAYIIKSAAREELLTTVRTISRDEDRAVLSVSRKTLAKLEERAQDILSSRELEVLSLAARAMTNAQIASHLYISEGTVKRHFTNIYAKLGVVSRIDAINKASAAGLIVTRESSDLASWS